MAAALGLVAAPARSRSAPLRSPGVSMCLSIASRRGRGRGAASRAPAEAELGPGLAAWRPAAADTHAPRVQHSATNKNHNHQKIRSRFKKNEVIIYSQIRRCILQTNHYSQSTQSVDKGDFLM